jgi:hypothetical protein
VRVRGYSDPATLAVEAYWITIGSMKPPPVVM